jgi:hypothetical protein
MSRIRANRRIVLGLLVGLSLLATGVIYAELQSGYYSPATLGEIALTGPRAQQPDAVYKVDAYQLYRPDLEPGAGRQDVEAYCNTCHTPSYITMQPPLPAAAWEAEVNKMSKAFGAQFPAESQAKILKYLESHYTPETRKR